VFFHFKGGKGVATAVGVLLGVDWVLALACLATFGIVVYFTRYVSLASMVAAVFAPVYFLFGANVVWPASPPVAGALVVMGALLIWRHSENLDRLLKGKESRLGAKK
jgi:acyl phosphate:glycerol-3-phosphate acyltransferase